MVGRVARPTLADRRLAAVGLSAELQAMKVWIGQIYVKPGVEFPFSHHMQGFLSDELSALATDASTFKERFGAGFHLMITVSADTKIADNRLKGPTLFKKDREVGYSVFLPYDVISRAPSPLQAAAEFLLSGVEKVFEELGIGAPKLEKKKAAIIKRLSTDPKMV